MSFDRHVDYSIFDTSKDPSYFTMGGRSCDECGKDAPAGQKLSVCSRCKSRQYCSKECQVNHWKTFHKAECPQLAKQREERLSQGVRLETGVPPVMSTRNVKTGKKQAKITAPTSRDHTEANIRQTMTSLLATTNKTHCAYVCMAFGLGNTHMMCPSLDEFKLYLLDVPGNLFQRRMCLGYRESEFSMLLVELQVTSKASRDTLAVSPGLPDEYGSSYYTEADLDKLVRKFSADNSPALQSIIIPYAQDREKIQHTLTTLLARHKTVEHVDLTGSSAVLNDEIMDLLKQQPHLEYLTFGQDNRYYPLDYEVSLAALQSLVQQCTNLKFLRIFHPIGDKKTPLDPTKGPVKDMLLAEGFIQGQVPEAEKIRQYSITENPTQFFRVDCEDGLISATWYERFVDNDELKAFYRKHFAAWTA